MKDIHSSICLVGDEYGSSQKGKRVVQIDAFTFLHLNFSGASKYLCKKWPHEIKSLLPYIIHMIATDCLARNRELNRSLPLPNQILQMKLLA